MEKILKTRIQHKIDTTANWTTAGNNGFVPLKGEIIFYSDGTGAFKVGDGSTNINNLPFATVNFIEKQNNTLALPRAYAASANSSEVELITVNESPTDASIARRGTGGRLQVGAPTATNHAATKGYVDGKFNSLNVPYTHAVDLTDNEVLNGETWIKVTIGYQYGGFINPFCKLYIAGYKIEDALQINGEIDTSMKYNSFYITHLVTDSDILWPNVEVSYTNYTCSFYFRAGILSINGCRIYLDDTSGLGDFNRGVTSFTAEFTNSLPGTFSPITSITTPVNLNQLKEEMSSLFSYTVGDGLAGMNGDLYVTVDRSNEIASVKLVDGTANAIESIPIPEFWCVDTDGIDNTDSVSPDNYLSFKHLFDYDNGGHAIARREFYVYNDSSLKCPGECDIILSGLSTPPTASISRDGIPNWIFISYSGGRIIVKTQENLYWNTEFLLHFDVRLVCGILLIKAEQII